MRNLPAQQAGVSLIEIMVGVVIALVASVGVLKMYSTNDTMRRSTTGGSDAMQTATMTTQNLNSLLQEIAGGLVASPRGLDNSPIPMHLLGCSLSLQPTAGVLLPPAASFSSPFNVVPTAGMRLTPVMVIDGGTSPDVLVTMGADSESGNLPIDIQFSVDRTKVKSVAPPIGFKAGDWVMAFDRVNVTDPGTCPIYKIDSSYTTSVDATTTGVLVGKAARFPGGSPYYVPLNTAYGIPGAATTYNTLSHLGANPNFKVFGIDTTKSRLLVLNLLLPINSTAGSGQINPLPIAENIYTIKFVYGVDNGQKAGTASGLANDGLVDDWVSPSAAGWTPDTAGLLHGDAATEAKLHQIVALRYAIVVRSSEPAPDQNIASLDLFTSLDASGFSYNTKKTITIPSDLSHYQFQVYEGVVSLRNMKNY